MVSKTLKTTSLVIGSGLGGIVIFLLVVAGVIYFNDNAQEPEASTTFYDKTYEQKFIEKLDSSNIPYRKEKNGSIWYSVKYQDQVKEIGLSVSSEYPAKFEINDKVRLTKFLGLLDEGGVEYSVYETENGKAVIVPREYQAKASESFRQAIGVR